MEIAEVNALEHTFGQNLSKQNRKVDGDFADLNAMSMVLKNSSSCYRGFDVLRCFGNTTFAG